jgi:ectoine hydroxylase-related dioxygenase (phytanoyl-CoA dioxygenase family)
MSAIRDFYHEYGYYVAKGVFDGKVLEQLETDFDRIVDQLKASKEDIQARWGGDTMRELGATDSVIYHTHNVQSYSANWLAAFQSKAFLDVVTEILGEDIILHHTKLFQKPAGKGSPFPMHQDWSYFPTMKDTMMAGIVHVSQATDEMGCLRVYPGSHKLGRLLNFTGQEKREKRHELWAKYPLEEATVLEAEPGDVVFFHYFTLHGSKANTSDQIRKTVLCQFYSGRDRVEDGNNHPDQKLCLQGWNYEATRNRANQTGS